MSSTHRVIVPDHMGFGKSETPQDKEYVFATHVENMIRLIDDLGLKDITFVAQDWGGPITGSIALRRPELVKRFCLINTMLGYSGAVRDAPSSENKPPKLTNSTWFQWVLTSHKSGKYFEVMKNLGDNVLSLMKKLGFENSAAVDDEWIRAYSLPFNTLEETKGAIEFPLDVAFDRVSEYVMEGLKMGNLDKVRSKPAMLAEGMKDKAMPPALVMSDFKRLFPNGPVVEIEKAGHFCQEDASETLVALIQMFIQMTESK